MGMRAGLVSLSLSGLVLACGGDDANNDSSGSADSTGGSMTGGSMTAEGSGSMSTTGGETETVGTATTTDDGSGSSGIATATASDSSGDTSGSSTGSGGTFENRCDACLVNTCTAELAACDDDCIALEACIATYCRGIGIDPGEEGACFVTCQDQHPQAEASHIAAANCVYDAACGVCNACGAADGDACLAFTQEVACEAEWEACSVDADCVAFMTCLAGCTTPDECFACHDTAPASADVYVTYQGCAAEHCLPTDWIPDAC